MTADLDDPDDRASFIPAAHLAAIGRIANAWATLEFSVDQVTWRVAGLSQMYGACLTAQMFSIQPKLRALIAVLELRGISSSTLARFNSFNGKDISPLQEKRNRAVHDARLIHAATGSVERLQITAQGALIFGFQPEPVKELHATRKRIEAAIRKFFTLRDEMFAELATLPETSARPQIGIYRSE